MKLKKIDVDNPTKKLLEPLVFDVQMICTDEIKKGVEFVVLYNVDVHSDSDDQILAEMEVAPIPKGTVGFKIETDAPDVDLIPVDQLFGLTSIIIVGKYMGQQFIRIGYIVDVSYPGIPSERLINNEAEESSEEIADEDDGDEEDEQDDDDEDDEHDEEDEEEIEVSEEDTCECKDACECRNSSTLIDAANQRIFGSEGKNEEEEERVCEESYSEIDKELDKTIGESVSERDENGDVFEYCGYVLDKSQIEMKLMVPPVISLFEISWGKDQQSSNDPSVDKEINAKKQKIK